MNGISRESREYKRAVRLNNRAVHVRLLAPGAVPTTAQPMRASNPPNTWRDAMSAQNINNTPSEARRQETEHHQHAARALRRRAAELAPHFQSGEPPKALSDWWGDGPASAFAHYRAGCGYDFGHKMEATDVVLQDAEHWAMAARGLEAAGKHELAQAALEWFKCLIGFAAWLAYVTNDEYFTEYEGKKAPTA